MKKRSAASILIILSLASSTALAAGEWDFRLSPYIWFAGLEGDMGSVPPQTIPVEVSPADALQDTRIGFMAMLEARKRRHGLLVDFIYTDVRSDEELVPALGLTLESTTKTLLATLAYQYAVIQEEHIAADLFAGLRGWSVDSVLQFGGGAGLLAGKRIENDNTWIDPVIGVKARTPIAYGFYASGGAGLGGFGVSSDLFYDASLNLGYQWNDAIGTAVGYRIFGVDYEDDGYVYDVVQQGWQLGLAWAF